MSSGKIKLIVAATVLGFFLHFWLSPYIMIYNISEKIRHKDSAGIAKSINFPAVKKNLKIDLKDIFKTHKQLTEPTSSLTSFLKRKILKKNFSERFIDKLIEKVVTPDGVVQLLDGKGLKINGRFIGRSRIVRSRGKGKSVLLKKFTVSHDSIHKVSILFRNYPSLRFIFHRNGLIGWKLNRIAIDYK